MANRGYENQNKDLKSEDLTIYGGLRLALPFLLVGGILFMLLRDVKKH